MWVCVHISVASTTPSMSSCMTGTTALWQWWLKLVLPRGCIHRRVLSGFTSPSVLNQPRCLRALMSWSMFLFPDKPTGLLAGCPLCLSTCETPPAQATTLSARQERVVSTFLCAHVLCWFSFAFLIRRTVLRSSDVRRDWKVGDSVA